MSYFYKNGFYNTEIHREIPSGAISISEGEYLTLLEGQASGKEIRSNTSGKPVLIERDELTLAQMKDQCKNILWKNYKAFQQKYVDAEDLILAAMCTMQGSAKGLYMQAWVNKLWQDAYYPKKDRIEGARTKAVLSKITLTVNDYEAPIYSVKELNDEVKAFQGQ